MIRDESNRHELTQWIKTLSKSMGFDACGISEACYLREDADRLQEWLGAGFHAGMGYMERNREKRLDPRLLVPGAKSVISFLLNYYPAEELRTDNNYRISRYAYGQDYHDVICGKLDQIIKELQRVSNPRVGNPVARVFTDSAPVLDRAWARRAGLGWIGKNTCLIHPKLGSYVFIGEIITGLAFEYDTVKINDLCGGCTRCIDACPTTAIIAPRRLDARKCISYHTIESKEILPVENKYRFGNWIFGCDICQEVCPWNRRPETHRVPEFMPSEELKSMNREKWDQLTREQFQQIFRNSAVKRTKFEGIKRNIEFLDKSD
jgi:epoxyqueuosine reductase